MAIYINKLTNEILTLTEDEVILFNENILEITDYRLLKYFFNGSYSKTVAAVDGFVSSVYFNNQTNKTLQNYGYQFPELQIRKDNLGTDVDYKDKIKIYVFRNKITEEISSKLSKLYGSLIISDNYNETNTYYLYPFGSSDLVDVITDLEFPIYENEKPKEYLYNYTGFQMYDGKIMTEKVAINETEGKVLFDTQCEIDLDKHLNVTNNYYNDESNNAFYVCSISDYDNLELCYFISDWQNIYRIKKTDTISLYIYNKEKDEYMLINNTDFIFDNNTLNLTNEESSYNDNGIVHFMVEDSSTDYSFVEIW